MPKTMKQARELAQSLIDSYQEGQADEDTLSTLNDVANERGQMLDSVVQMRWFRDEVADFITSNEGCSA